ncbi:hypothetical protein CEW92_15445 [Bacillaceae bacterium SAS-127]|nr:hypothetical protein CEW92_15445 [Bacillaceae bacterium SAS-127]
MYKQSAKNRKVVKKITGFGLLYGIFSFLYSLINGAYINIDAVILIICMLILFVDCHLIDNKKKEKLT